MTITVKQNGAMPSNLKLLRYLVIIQKLDQVRGSLLTKGGAGELLTA